MKRAFIVVAMVVLTPWYGIAFAQPRIIPRMARVPHDAQQTFRILKEYFSNPALGGLQLISADPATGTLVAKRDNIDSGRWREWAYCSLGPEHLLDTLSDGAVTVNVKIEPSGNNASYVTVTADFEGTYSLGSSSTTSTCISRGVLETHILEAAGAQPPPSS